MVHNSGENKNDSSDVYDVPFKVDLTAPKFKLSVDDLCVNPDSAVFVARFAWADTGLPDIRAMGWRLERKEGDGFSLVKKLPSLYDVSSKEFAVAWDKVPERGKLQDGLYRVSAAAIDYAAPSVDAYSAALNLVNAIASNKDESNAWAEIERYKFNRAEESVEFRVDRTAPKLTFRNVGGIVLDSQKVFTYGNLNRPERDKDFAYVSEDSLLQVAYSVEELLGGRDSTAVTVAWLFVHAADTSKKDRAGDSLWVRDAVSNRADGLWKELDGMRLQDGDYVLRASVRDEAKNVKSYQYEKKIRIDRTAPKIASLVCSRLVYPDSVKDFGATLVVSEQDDLKSNRTGMQCHYRVLGGDADGLWRNVGDRTLHQDTVKFKIPAEAVGVKNGKRYLEGVCIDAAGNAGVRTDLFHVGDRYPVIVSPVEDKKYLTAEYIPVVGIAPPSSIGGEGSTIYRLRYREENSDAWQSANIAAVSTNRSLDSAHFSRTAQSTEGVLGYLHNVGFSESRVWIELATRSCDSCEWRKDSTLVTIDEPAAEDSVPKVLFAVSPSSMFLGKDRLDISLRMVGNFKGDYFLRVYAEDSKGVGLFDKSEDRAFANPFYGVPADTSLPKGVWFYEKDGNFHLVWKGLQISDSISVAFNSENFGTTCLASNGITNLENGCITRKEIFDASAILQSMKVVMSEFPVWQLPAHTDSVMILFGNSGHVLMNATGAFRVGLKLPSNEIDLPVYFGESSESGFAFMGADVASAVNPWSTGWNVNPKSYGMRFVWDGITSTKSYPASGNITLHAEVIQNVNDNPYVFLKDTVVSLTLPSLEIALDNLPDFYMLKNVDNEDSLVNDSEEKGVFEMERNALSLNKTTSWMS